MHFTNSTVRINRERERERERQTDRQTDRDRDRGMAFALLYHHHHHHHWDICNAPITVENEHKSYICYGKKKIQSDCDWGL